MAASMVFSRSAYRLRNLGLNSWASDNKWDMDTFFVEELFAAGVANAVICHEQDNGVLKITVTF